MGRREAEIEYVFDKVKILPYGKGRTKGGVIEYDFLMSKSAIS